MIAIDGNSLTIDQVWQAAYSGVPVALADAARSHIQASRDTVERWVAEGAVIYGVTTGFGAFESTRIAPESIEALQENLILSHAAGVGDPLPPAIVRAMLLLRANALAKGFSGVRVETVEHLLAMLNQYVLAVIPSQGSVGSSGDLAPLSHLALSAIGRGMVWDLPASGIDARVLGDMRLGQRPAADLMRERNITPLRLQAKEGLALINGTQMMSAFGALAVREALRLARIADVAAALSVEALLGSDTPYDARLHAARPMPGQIAVAANMRAMMQGSALRSSHFAGDLRVQDAYSMRCVPQVHGASRDAIAYVTNVLSTEINSATDNPLIIAADNAHLEGGNFHGQPLALALDFLAIALAELASISERRIDRLMHGLAFGKTVVPPFLTEQGGLHSGYMIAQYTAASIVSENKGLAHPASVDSIPTSKNQEDHNSMGSIAAQKCWRVVRNVRSVLAIELLCACEALEYHTLSPGAGTEIARRLVRTAVPRLQGDRETHLDIRAVEEFLSTDALLDAVRNAVQLT